MKPALVIFGPSINNRPITDNYRFIFSTTGNSAWRMQDENNLAEECGIAPEDRKIYVITGKSYSEKEMLERLEQEGIVESLFEILNWLGMTRNIQKYVLERRPDLINKIKDLDPSLKEEYEHEWSLSQVEI